MQITFRPDGTAQQIGSDISLLADSVARCTKRRASHVTPKHWLLRLAFCALRACCRETGAVAAWTRGWKCEWQVQIVGGPLLPGVFTDRADAIRAEVAWLQENRL